jgi:hypothetical protein
MTHRLYICPNMDTVDPDNYKNIICPYLSSFYDVGPHWDFKINETWVVLIDTDNFSPNTLKEIKRDKLLKKLPYHEDNNPLSESDYTVIATDLRISADKLIAKNTNFLKKIFKNNEVNFDLNNAISKMASGKSGYCGIKTKQMNI